MLGLRAKLNLEEEDLNAPLSERMGQRHLSFALRSLGRKSGVVVYGSSQTENGYLGRQFVLTKARVLDPDSVALEAAGLTLPRELIYDLCSTFEIGRFIYTGEPRTIYHFESSKGRKIKFSQIHVHPVGAYLEASKLLRCNELKLTDLEPLASR